MKFVFTQKAVEMFSNCLDVTIKVVGLKGLYTVTELVGLLENPIETNEEEKTYTYQISEEQVSSLKEVLNITVKQLGLDGTESIRSLNQLLQSPIEESE